MSVNPSHYQFDSLDYSHIIVSIVLIIKILWLDDCYYHEDPENTVLYCT